jgi:predicted small metal-binding protein
MKQFRCGDVIPGCSATFRGEDETDILRQVATHAREDHGMTEIPPTLPPIVLARTQDLPAS